MYIHIYIYITIYVYIYIYIYTYIHVLYNSINLLMFTYVDMAIKQSTKYQYSDVAADAATFYFCEQSIETMVYVILI